MAEQNGAFSRRGFIALAGGTVAAGSALAACGGESTASAETAEFGDGDLGILKYLLGVEYILSAFYADAGGSTNVEEDVQKALAKFGEQEAEHVEALQRQIKKAGGEAQPNPGSRFFLGSEAKTLEIGEELENAAAAAYLAQLPKVENESLRLKLAEIHTVQGRHAAAIAFLRGTNMTPNGAFAKPATVDAVMAVVQPHIAGGAPS